MFRAVTSADVVSVRPTSQKDTVMAKPPASAKKSASPPARKPDRKAPKAAPDKGADTRGNGDELHQPAGGAHPALTTNQGVAVPDNQNSLRAHARGPTLLEDFILREKITHFDHERIPERIVHARGSAAHGYFELTHSLRRYTTANILTEVGQRTPLFARFSTVAGGAGSVDTPRDVRGFAVKFYTREGNWDLVGNNIPIFFIQDAMKFPDLVHAVKMEPDRGFPQAASAHDNFWDFISLTPESMHTIVWAMSDRAIPRSLRMMEGFGIHSFRLLDANGKSTFVKFHWRPKLGLQSTLWDEAVKIAGADPDFHRRDLFEAIEAGQFPEWELSVQLFAEEQADAFPFDHLDATKLIPEELVPLTVIGRMVLDRWPDNFFAETEQVAFCPSHLVPGIDFSNDPLLQGRLFSYLDTQLSRLGSPNFHQLPINAPKCPFANQQRDAIVLRQGAIVCARRVRFQQFGNRALVNSGVLPHVEACQMEAETIDRAAQQPQTPAGDHAGPVGNERAIDDIEIGLEFGHAGIGRGLADRRPARLHAQQMGRCREPRVDTGYGAAIWLAAAMRRLIGRAFRQRAQFR